MLFCAQTFARTRLLQFLASGNEVGELHLWRLDGSGKFLEQFRWAMRGNGVRKLRRVAAISPSRRPIVKLALGKSPSARAAAFWSQLANSAPSRVLIM